MTEAYLCTLIKVLEIEDGVVTRAEPVEISFVDARHWDRLGYGTPQVGDLIHVKGDVICGGITIPS